MRKEIQSLLNPSHPYVLDPPIKILGEEQNEQSF